MTLNEYLTKGTVLKKGTKKAGLVTYYLNIDKRWTYNDIYEAYEKPSVYKVRSFNAIRERAYETDGYNHDLQIVGKNCMQYSTLYTFTQDGKTYAVKDTRDNMYITEL